jgi:hypothetical protein
VLYLALQISASAGSLPDFNYYFDELKKYNSAELGSNQLLNFVSALFNGEFIDDELIKDYSSVIEESNCELIFSLIEKYPNLETKLKLLEHSSSKLSEHTAFLNTYGLALLESNEPAKAAELFEKSLSKKITEPAILFYLISSYVQLESFEKIVEVIEIAEKHFAELPEVMNRVEILKQKLAVFV